MNEIKCRIENCAEVHRTAEAVSPNATFLCKNHPRAVQVRAMGGIYKPEIDEKDKDVHFQDHQFDKSLRTKGNKKGAL